MPFQDVMNTILPPQDDQSPHITGNGHYGAHRQGQPDHGGTDFNYEGGQQGINMNHPAIHSPVSGEVTFVGGDLRHNQDQRCRGQ